MKYITTTAAATTATTAAHTTVERANVPVIKLTGGAIKASPIVTFRMEGDKKVNLEINKRVDPVMAKLMEMSNLNDKVEVKLCQFIDTNWSEERQDFLRTWLRRVHKEGIIGNSGKCFVSFGHGTNQGKKDEVLFTLKELVDPLYKWMDCGASKTMKMTVAKYIAYHGLLMVATEEFGFPIEPEEVYISDSKGEYEIYAQHKVADDKGVSDLQYGPVTEKCSDGTAYIWVTNEMIQMWINLYGEEVANNMYSAWMSLADGTLRAPWMKGGFVVFPWQEALKRMGITKLNGIDVDYYIMHTNKSVLKASIGDKDSDAYKSYAEYCNAFRNLGHRYGILLRDLPSTPKNLPFQQVLAMSSASAEAKQDVANIEAEYVTSLTTEEGYIKLLPPVVRKIAEITPEILRTSYSVKRIKDQYARIRKEGISGKIHRVAQYHFIQKDPIAVLQYEHNLTVTGAIPAGKAFTKCGLVGEGCISRNPSPTAQSSSVVYFTGKVFGPWSDLFDKIRSNTVFLSYFGIEALKMDADFDGDEVFMTTDEKVVRCLKETHEATGDYVVVWNAPSGKKEVISRKKIEEYFNSLTGRNDLGIYCDYATLIYAYFNPAWNLTGEDKEITVKWMVDGTMKDVTFKPEPQKALDWIKYAINVLVDASKHVGGSGSKIELPLFVDMLVNKYEYDHMNAAWRKVNRKHCTSIAFGKNIKREAAGEKLCTPMNVTFNSHSFTDIIGKAVYATPETVNIEINNNYDFTALTSCGHPVSGKMVAGVCRDSKFEGDPAEGLWNRMVFANAAEWKAAIADEHERRNMAAFNAEKRKIAISQLKAYAEEIGVDYDMVVDRITTYTFENAMLKSEQLMNMYVGFYFEVFTEDICKNLEKTTNVIIGKLEDEPVDVDVDF